MNEYAEQVEKRIRLYERFLSDIWNKMLLNNGYNQYVPLRDKDHRIMLESYLSTFPMLKEESSYRVDAIDLINYIDTKCNGVMPEHIQVLFNEFFLERL